MNSHDRAQELISARMDAPLTAAEHRELQNHLATCTACRVFVSQADDIALELQAMPLLPSSPAVSRAVMSAIATDTSTSGWGWLRHTLQALSSPGMAVASSMALVVALAGALFVAMNAPGGGNNPGQGVAPEGTIAAVAEVALPTEIPTEEPEPANIVVAATEPPAEPTATREVRTIEPPPTEAPETPTPQPTATAVPIVQTSDVPVQPVNESPPIQPASEPVNDGQVYDEPELAMAAEPAGAVETAELAQAAEPPVESAPVQETIEEAPVVSEPVDPAPAETAGDVAPAAEPASASEDAGQNRQGRSKDESARTASEAPVEEPEPTRPIGPLPIEAIAALEGVDTPPEFSLPPAPIDPAMPDQSFLPVTPTPEADGTPTPESEQASNSEAPQLAEEWSGELPVTALAPEADAVVAEAPDSESKKSKKIKDEKKRDKSSSAGKSHEQQQAAFQGPLGWSSQPMAMEAGAVQPLQYQEPAEQPVAPEQTADYPVDASSTSGETAETTGTGTADSGTAEATEPEPQIDPATGMEIDPATGYLIDPTTGYLLDRVNGRVIDPRTSYEVHPGTGLLIDPATGAMLDPNTLQVVIPAGFGSDQPAYNPGDPAMRGAIETVVDDTYDNASIKMIPATDGPVQPVGEIVIPTETGEAVEIS